jgi:hypothetical protein
MTTSTDTLSRERRPFLGFERERKAYETRKNELLESMPGKFVVLVGGQMIGPFSTEDEAERAGYETFGLGPLYIKRILAEEPFVVLPIGVESCQL